jgi:hypothetical protein
MAKRRTRARLQNVKRSFIVTLSAAGASGLVGMGCAGSALGGLDDGHDDPGDPVVRTPMAGSPSNPPFVPMPIAGTSYPPFPTPLPRPPISGQGGAPGIAGVGGSYNPPSPCLQVPVNGTSCSFEITCEYPQTRDCVPGKRAVCSGNRWIVTDWHQWSCNPPPVPPGEDAGTAFD